MPTVSYSGVAPVGFSASTPRPMRSTPRRWNSPKLWRSSALPSPRPRQGRRTPSAPIQPPPTTATYGEMLEVSALVPMTPPSPTLGRLLGEVAAEAAQAAAAKLIGGEVARADAERAVQQAMAERG